MRSLLILIFPICFSSCDGNNAGPKTLLKPVIPNAITITLKDSLGNISFSVPSNFDTSFTWTNRSDCGKPCDREQYRFQPKTLPIFKESGFYYQIPDIPLDQITIIHSGYFPFHEATDSTINLKRHDFYKRRIISESYSGKISFDTIEKVNDRYFSITAMNGFDTAHQKHFTKVVAISTIKGNEIEFDFDLKTKDPINTKEYFQKSLQLIRTISITRSI